MNPDDRYYITGEPPETPEPQGQPDPWTTTTTVGTRQPRIDGYERVSGTALYSSDVLLPDMLYAATLRCPHAAATVTRIDTSRAEKMPGVAAVMTHRSPGAEIPWYNTRSGPLSRLIDPTCRYEGEEVAVVAAETPYQAWDAVRAIDVQYEQRPFVSEERAALAAGAPTVHQGDNNRVGDPARYERGDVQAGFAQADAVVERSFTTGCEIHVPTEAHVSVAKWEGPRLVVWDSTQGVYAVQAGLAQSLKLPVSHVRVIGHYMGGGFGAKLGLSKHTVLAALLARRTGRPVKYHLSREESFLAVGNRPASRMTMKAGAKKDGTLTALEMTVIGSGGAYPGGGVGGVDWVVRDLYTCPNVRTEAQDVFINAGQARPFRAPGHPQGAWALEQVMDELAEKIGLDPVAFRLKNVPAVSQARRDQPYSTTGLKACLEEGAKRFGWAEARKRAAGDEVIRRGVGVAAGQWQGGAGGPPATILVKVFADGSANLNMGAADIGTGTKTVMSMIVTEELGIPPDRIQVEWADTGTTQFATPSGGSKTVPTESPAVRAAALDVKQQLLALAAEQLKVTPQDVAFVGGEIAVTADPSKKVALGAIQGLQRRGLVVGVGYRGPNPEGIVTCPFGAHFAEVEVNTRTGEVKVTRLLAAQDSGRPLNELTYENQVHGGLTMGVGLALTEARILDADQTGKMVNRNWHDYKVPTAMDLPAEQVVVPVDLHDYKANSTAVKGIGEPATIPTAPAIANAIYHACGVRTPDAPVSPARLVALLGAANKKG
ncbi:MAG TPA: xanthine dehydrogenase family protein molybdopterin-binding subunit [Vicinamibacterales bacterium]|nr:xanthine dehydrogenase family protein molybdopterin-binding subunit [Vicinamibacterales bacterium]